MSTTNVLDSGLSGRDFYAEKFRSDLDRQAEWLRRGARQKADSIIWLQRHANIDLESIIEIGSGTGAVIAELRGRGVGTRHFAVDYSEQAIAELRRAEPEIESAVADVTVTPDPFGQGPYDLAYATHVVEHLEEPESFLSALLAVPTKYFIAEVPLEDLLFGKLKALVIDRSKHTAGHVQFFTRKTFEALLKGSGWRVVASHTYAPVLDAETFEFAYGRASPLRRRAKWLTEYALPRRLGSAWTTFYHAHHAVLCVKDPHDSDAAAL